MNTKKKHKKKSKTPITPKRILRSPKDKRLSKVDNILEKKTKLNNNIINNSNNLCFWNNFKQNPSCLYGDESEKYYEMFLKWIEQSKIIEKEQPDFFCKSEIKKKKKRKTQNLSGDLKIKDLYLDSYNNYLNNDLENFNNIKKFDNENNLKISEKIFVLIINYCQKNLNENNVNNNSLNNLKNNNCDNNDCTVLLQEENFNDFEIVDNYHHNIWNENKILDVFDIIDVKENSYINTKNLYLIISIIVANVKKNNLIFL
jgi:hypothetical protein